ncbi:hypothetical protein L1987_21998 [Smallanthus sonchifolius]|uniref:Uncharacterized protein n=1 Tax=Smallanthus sonchifolius TaxID=185202 RepID=A0ACB9IE91_9ASTR|nr:hypothetical protein L1987_21998 [Smallanthus sonchifolius]
MAGAVDMSFSSYSNLELFKLDFPSDDHDLPFSGAIPSSEPCKRLSWGKSPSLGSKELSLGLIAGDLVDGSIGVWNPSFLKRYGAFNRELDCSSFLLNLRSAALCFRLQFWFAFAVFVDKYCLSSSIFVFYRFKFHVLPNGRVDFKIKQFWEKIKNLQFGLSNPDNNPHYSKNESNKWLTRPINVRHFSPSNRFTPASVKKAISAQTESELADLDAISALKESAAIELKEEGNKYVKMGNKHYSEAIKCYTRAINQKALSDTETSILFSNRAHVNLLLGNYGRGLSDSEEAIKLSPANVKDFYRAAKASLSLNKLIEAKAFSEKGLDHNPENEELKKLKKQIDSQISELQQHEAQVSEALKTAKDLVSAIEDRELKIGKATFQKLTGLKKPILDKDHILHWPVLLLYAEVMSSDFIEDFCETDIAEPLPWDKENAYTRDAIELYYEAGSGVCLSKKEIISNFLQGTVASHLETFGYDETDRVKSSPKEISSVGNNRSKWVKVNERRTLDAVLKETNFVIPGIPVFFVVSKRSSFYKDFKSGNWSLPS